MKSETTIEGKTSIPEDPTEEITVKEKILLFGQNRRPKINVIGPEITYFFHELEKHQPKTVAFFSKVLGVFLFLFFLLTLPLFALLIKITSKGPIIISLKCTGKKGESFKFYKFRTQDSQNKKTGYLGSFLETTYLYKLPACINILKGDLNLIGPEVLSSDINNKLNNTFSQYYKRFAVEPGLIGVISINNNKILNFDYAYSSLEKELAYVTDPTLTNFLKLRKSK